MSFKWNYDSLPISLYSSILCLTLCLIYPKGPFINYKIVERMSPK